MALSEIEKLENRWRENQQGLTFAPLAEAYRKSGDPARALEVLKSGLELHPDYIPASIVLGRCHLDLGDGAAAEIAFSHVLTLDPENVIALKALADVGERHQRYDDAERWLRQLLAVDRSNDEARQQLTRIEVAREQAVTMATRNGGADLQEPASADDEFHGASDIAAPAVTEPSAAEHDEPSVAPPSAVTEEPAALPVLSELEPTVSAEPIVPPAEVDPIGGLVPSAFSAPEEPPPTSALDGFQAEDPQLEDFGIEQHPEIELRASDRPIFQVPSASDDLREIATSARGASEFQTSSAAEELVSAGEPAPETADDVASFLGSAFDTPPAATDEAADESGVDPLPEFAEFAGDTEPIEPAMADIVEADADTTVLEIAAAPRAEPRAEPGLVGDDEPEPVVTETMADLLVRQGHHAAALDVYRELAMRAPGNARLQARVAELSAMQPAPAAAEAVVVPEPAPVRRRLDAAATGGQSAGDMLRQLLAARPGEVAGGGWRAEAAAPAPPSPAPESTPAAATDGNASEGDGSPGGAPTRPAPDHLSLSAVFGEDVSPVPPAVRTPEPAGKPAAGDGVSFDEFFSGGGSVGAPSRARVPRGRDDDDLDQFHVWLQNLKK